MSQIYSHSRSFVGFMNSRLANENLHSRTETGTTYFHLTKEMSTFNWVSMGRLLQLIASMIFSDVLNISTVRHGIIKT